jgi:hypothetical protein
MQPFFAEHTCSERQRDEYCGKPETHDYQLYLAINHIEHPKTKVNNPDQCICERIHRTILQDFYQIAFWRKIYRSIEELQIDLDEWLHTYNHDRTHQGKMCSGRAPMQTLIDGKEVWNDKITALNTEFELGNCLMKSRLLQMIFCEKDRSLKSKADFISCPWVTRSAYASVICIAIRHKPAATNTGKDQIRPVPRLIRMVWTLTQPPALRRLSAFIIR